MCTDRPVSHIIEIRVDFKIVIVEFGPVLHYEQSINTRFTIFILFLNLFILIGFRMTIFVINSQKVAQIKDFKAAISPRFVKAYIKSGRIRSRLIFN